MSADVKRTRFQYEASGVSSGSSSKEPLEQGIINAAENLIKLFEVSSSFPSSSFPWEKYCVRACY
jgi:hypothetical protein